MKINLSFWVQRFFEEYLHKQRNVSPHTLAAYRDTFRLLLLFLQGQYHLQPEQADLRAITAKRVLAFLQHLEAQRHNQIRTRNARLAALRSWIHYLQDALGSELPCALQQVLTLPFKGYTQRLLGFLSRDQIQALLAVTEQSWSGRRNYLLFLLLYNTGARVSEITGACVRDVSFSRRAFLQLQGKGRKQRPVPLWPVTRRVMRQWIRSNQLLPDSPLVSNRLGEPLTRWGVAWLLRDLVRRAQAQCPSLKQQAISPHTLRHSAAMHLLQSGVDPTVISLYLGHQNLNTTHLYLEADLKMKQDALNKVKPPRQKSCAVPLPDKLIRFLESL
jgi:integrase/recombinase XerD